MSHDILDNPKAPRVRRVAALARKKERFERGSFLVEGPLATLELLTHAPDIAQTVYLSLDFAGSTEIEQLADEHSVTLIRVSPQVLAAMADTVTPQGVVSVAMLQQADLHHALSGARLVAVLHEVRDPGNAGAVVRAADAAGADAVIFSGDSIDPWHPKVVRATTGSLFHLPVMTVPTLSEAIDAVRDAGLTSVAADVHGDDLSPGDPLLVNGIAWVFGNEARGLTLQEREQADRVIRLPIYGNAESLNLATAASVCLYTTAFAQRGGGGAGSAAHG